jgi:hypothetical protein
MQQTRADDLVLAKLRRNVLKEGVAVRNRDGRGGFHQPDEIVVRQAQSQLVEWSHSKLPKKSNPDLVRLPGLGNSLNAQRGVEGGLARPRQPFTEAVTHSVKVDRQARASTARLTVGCPGRNFFTQSALFAR